MLSLIEILVFLTETSTINIKGFTVPVTECNTLLRVHCLIFVHFGQLPTWHAAGSHQTFLIETCVLKGVKNLLVVCKYFFVTIS